MPYRRNRYRRKFPRRKRSSRGSWIARRNRIQYRKRLFRKKKLRLRRTIKTNDAPIKKFLFNGFCVASAASFTSDGTSATAPLVCPIMHNEHWTEGVLDTLPHAPASQFTYRYYHESLAAGGSIDTVAELLHHEDDQVYRDSTGNNEGICKVDVSGTSGAVTKYLGLTQQDVRSSNRVLFRKMKLILNITPVTSGTTVKGHIEIGYTHGYPKADLYVADSQYLLQNDGWDATIVGRYRDNDGFTAIYEKQWLDRTRWKSLYTRGFKIDGERNESTTLHITVPYYKILTYYMSGREDSFEKADHFHLNSSNPYMDYDLMIDDRYPWSSLAPYMVIFNHNTANDFSVNCQVVCEYQDLPGDSQFGTAD